MQRYAGLLIGKSENIFFFRSYVSDTCHCMRLVLGTTHPACKQVFFNRFTTSTSTDAVSMSIYRFSSPTLLATDLRQMLPLSHRPSYNLLSSYVMSNVTQITASEWWFPNRRPAKADKYRFCAECKRPARHQARWSLGIKLDNLITTG